MTAPKYTHPDAAIAIKILKLTARSTTDAAHCTAVLSLTLQIATQIGQGRAVANPEMTMIKAAELLGQETATAALESLTTGARMQ